MAPVIAAVAKVVVAAVAKVTFAAVAKFVVTTALSIGVSKLLAKRAMSKAQAGGEGGGRIQLPPATDNKIPVVYGTAFIGGSIIDAMLSTDQKTMWYVVALAEHTDTTLSSGYSFGDIYYDGKLVQFGTNGAVTGLITNNAAPGLAQIDTRVNGFLYIYLFSNGSSSGTNTGGLTAAQIISVANGVPIGKAWGANQTMTNCAFAIVKVRYSTDAGTTGVGALTAQITNSIDKPGDAILDYMQNERYGCAIPLSRIDTASLTDLNTYSDDLIDYKPVGWNPGDPYSQQARYRINGPLDTSQSCLDNLQFLVDSCDSWLQYSELTGKWRVVMNKGYDQAPNAQVLNDLFLVNSSNLVGGIDISPIDLNETYNQLEVAYPNTNIKDQTDYQIVDLFTEFPSLLSENEAVNRLNVTLPLVNNAVQAKYLGVRRLFQSREDLVISMKLDFSGIQIEAGDVIRVTHETYGWTDKLFRVNSVAEEKDSEGNLFAIVQAFEYNGTVFADDPVQDFVPDPNTGLEDPNVISTVFAPVALDYTTNEALVTGILLGTIIPEQGTILYMDFNFGSTSNVDEHVRYKTINQSNGTPFINSNIAGNSLQYAYCEINDLIAGNYYFSVTARNDFAGRSSNASNAFVWGGANIQPYDPFSNTGGIIGNQIQANTITGYNIQANTITGNLIQANTITGNQIQANTITGNNIQANTITGNLIQANTITGAKIQVDTITANNIVANTITGNKIAANTITGNNVAANTISGNNIQSNTITFNNIITGTTLGEYVQQYAYSIAIPVSNVVNAPIDITTCGANANLEALDANSYFQQPKYLIGTTVGTNYVYPYYQGTSTTANGWQANSTSPLYPAQATQYQAVVGTDNWWPYEFVMITPLSTSELLDIEWRGQFVSNVDTTIQISRFIKFSTLTSNMSFQADDHLHTIRLYANEPQYVYYYATASGSGAVNGAGMVIRNMDSGSNVLITSGRLQISKTK
jgi:hypothetical protein